MRNGPENSTGSCGMIVSLERNECNPIVDMSISSMTILPPAASMILNNDKVSDDFPAPVRPLKKFYFKIFK
jgi:hypothetical protein